MSAGGFSCGPCIGSGWSEGRMTTDDGEPCECCRGNGYHRTDDIAICDACRSGDCDDCDDSAWSDLANFPCTCDCLASGHSLQRDIAEDEAADRALTAHYEERA